MNVRNRRGRTRSLGRILGTNKNNNLTADEYAQQNDLLGIMSYALLVDPVRIRGENTPGAYERAEITKWLSQPNGGRSPSTNQVASVDDLVPAEDIRNKIRTFVARYPEADIVKDWLREQPTWYTHAIQEIRNFTAPVVTGMTRMADNIRNNLPTEEKCDKCLEDTTKGAVEGACSACQYHQLRQQMYPQQDDGTGRIGPHSCLGCTAAGACFGAACGAAYGHENVRKMTGTAIVAAETAELCAHCLRMSPNGGKRRRRKTRRKKTRKRKTRRKKRKSRRRKKTKKRKTKKR